MLLALQVLGDEAFDLLSERAAPLTLVCGDEHPTVWYHSDEGGADATAVGGDCWYAVDSLARAEALVALADWRRRSRPSSQHARSARGKTLPVEHTPSTLPDDPAPSARLVPPAALAAPTQPRAPPQHIVSLRISVGLSQALASGQVRVRVRVS